MDVLRTPDERFENLPDFPYAPHYVDVDDLDGGRLRIAYVDEGPRSGRPVILFHGEPTWSYLYRRMIPLLVQSGHRVLVPDLVGMGRSDKPVLQSDYRYERHVAWMSAWLDSVDPQGAVWFGQDWGSFIGLGMVCRQPDRFAAIVLANGVLADPDNMARMIEFAMTSSNPGAFGAWQEWIRNRTEIDCGAVVADGVPGAFSGAVDLSPAERAAYNAPFPDPRYQAGALVFPFVGSTMSAEGRAICTASWKVLESWTKPLITAYGKADPILGWADALFHKYVPGASGMPHRQFANGQHFIQEVEAEALCGAINDAIAAI